MVEVLIMENGSGGTQYIKNEISSIQINKTKIENLKDARARFLLRGFVKGFGTLDSESSFVYSSIYQISFKPVDETNVNVI